MAAERKNFIYESGAIVRGDTTLKNLALVFTGDEFADGAESILTTLKKENIKASFFLTGKFYRNKNFKSAIKKLKKEGHYLGAHSNEHLLYALWEKRDSLLVTKKEFTTDLEKNYAVMKTFGIQKLEAQYFLPPYEWYNDSIAKWTKDFGLQLINYSKGTLSAADYTHPQLKNYRSSETIMASIKNYEASSSNGLSGFILLVHIGTDARRTDKFYKQLPELIQWLKQKGYKFEKINELLN